MPPKHEETPQDKAQKICEMALVDALKGYVGEALGGLAAARLLEAPTAPDGRPLIRKKHPLH